MVAALILAAVATATPTPTVTPTARPTVAATTAPLPGSDSETYGAKLPAQLRPDGGRELAPEPTPTIAPNSLAGVAARIKINRAALAEIQRRCRDPQPKTRRLAAGTRCRAAGNRS